MSVRPDPCGPLLRVLWPDGRVVVEVVREMVGHQVLARHPQVHRVPVLKLPLHPVQAGLGNLGLFGERCRLEEDVVPDLRGHLLGLDLQDILLVGPGVRKSKILHA